MVKNVKKTGTRVQTNENTDRKNFMLLRDNATQTHYIVPECEILTAKKVDRLKPCDEVNFVLRGNRLHGTILIIGKTYFLWLMLLVWNIFRI